MIPLSCPQRRMTRQLAVARWLPRKSEAAALRCVDPATLRLRLRARLPRSTALTARKQGDFTKLAMMPHQHRRNECAPPSLCKQLLQLLLLHQRRPAPNEGKAQGLREHIELMLSRRATTMSGHLLMLVAGQLAEICLMSPGEGRVHQQLSTRRVKEETLFLLVTRSGSC